MKISPMMASPAHSSSNSKPNASAIPSFSSPERSPLRPLSVKEKEMEGQQFSYETDLEISQLLPKFSFHRPDIKNPVLDFLADEDVLKSGGSISPPSSSNISELAAATTENQATQDNSPVATFSTPELLSILQKADSGILAKADSSIHRSISPNRSNDNLLLDGGKFIDKSESDQDQTNVICASQKNSQQTCQVSEQSVNINKREESIIYTPKESLQNIIYISSDEKPFPFKSNVDHKAHEEFVKNYCFSVEYEIDKGLINISTNTITEESVLLSIPSVHNEMITDTIVNVHGKEANQEREERTTQILTMRHASESSLCSEKGPHADRQEEEYQSQRSPSSNRSFRPEKGHDRDHHQEERHQPQKSLPPDKCDRPLSHEKAHHRDHHREERHQPQLSQSSEKCDTPLSPEKRHHSDYHRKGKQQRQKSRSSDECDTPLSPEEAHYRDHHREERHQPQRSLSSNKCDTPLSPEKGHHRDHRSKERHHPRKSQSSDECDTPLSPEKSHHRDHHREERHQAHKSLSSDKCDTPLSPEKGCYRGYYRKEKFKSQRSPSSDKCDRSLCPEREHYRDSQLRSSRSSGSKYGKYKYQFPTHGREKWKKQKFLPYSYPDQIRPNERLKHRSRSPVREALLKGSAKFTTGKKWHRVTLSEGRNLCNKNSPSEDKRSSESFFRSQRSLERQQTHRKKPNCSQRSQSPEAVYLNKRRDQHRDPLSRFTSSETRLSCKKVHTYKKSRGTARHSSTLLEVRDCRERNREQDNYFQLRKSPYRIIPPKHQHRDSSGKYQSSGARQSPEEEVQMHSQSKHKVSTSPIFLKDQDIQERNQGQDHHLSSKKRARDGDRHSNYHDRHNRETKSSGNSANHKRSPQSPDFSHQQKLEVTHETETTLPLDSKGTDLSPNAGLSQEVIMCLKEKGLYDDYVKFWKLKKSQRQQEEKMSPDEYRTSDASNIQDGSGCSLQDSDLEDGQISSDSVSSNFGAEPNSRSATDQQDLEIKELMAKRRKIEESSDENTSTSDLPVKYKHEAKNLLDKQNIDSFLRKIHPPEKEGIHFIDSE
ncbi:uncharacterized protein [Bemisia tabaci]|uniref:uncharacterized protein n=1 Tax=Bemisia tabaci TaxID=7038 RepID=UPI003B28B1B1